MPFLPFSKLFKKKTKYSSFEDIKVGDMVEVKFVDPRDVGIQAPNGQLTCTRFNQDEFENRTFKGIVNFIGNWEGGPNYGKYAIFEARKNGTEFRKFLLLKYEIETIRILE